MQRGTLTLTNSEQQMLSSLIEASAVASSLIASRLKQPSHDTENIIELSSEEAESVLDLLPIPSVAEPNEITSARQKLSAFLQNL
ncbi:MAG: hypothetical protein GW762_03425 [Candidatus Pacebacteria bacterium]|nr:hypothetical protein [Candidatus Paceibacterota bacterium]PIR63402.1 MAG: hypothetical protein COU64_04710 [Candidatus Pacebacteria bacterium CG10_big_fil_rev_8_21_14_0_10_40_26]PIZ79612.1 MAG: hypothetical protein COY01_00630 [Candidatus Pacebacteria bacterium CG_4_10_14_0_2_um_filter_40_20]PJC41801.1 MAG: hypothetical protein CO041_03725 [Candidatus Pacebacteria bacterium CG_4_9_14_0_2_um_filter_40_15]